VFGHPEVHHTASIMGEHEEDKQNPEGRRRYGEKVDCCGLGKMIR